MKLLQMVGMGVPPGLGHGWQQGVGWKSPGSLPHGGSSLETEPQDHLWVALHTAAGATWFQGPEYLGLERRWSHLQSTVGKTA